MTTVSILAPSDEQSLADWDAYVDAHPDATPYHRSDWCRIFEEGLGYRGFLLLARDEAGSVSGVLPLYRVRGLCRPRLVAVPFRDRGGPLWSNEPAFTALLDAATQLAARHGAGTLVLKTLRPFPDGPAAAARLVRRDHWVHSILSIDDVDEAQLWKQVGAKTRNMIRQGREQGLACRLAGHGADAGRRWHALHLATQRRLGVPPFPRRFFEAMFAAPGARDGIALLEVHRNGHPLAATILLLHGDTCIYGYSASSEEGQRARANDLMLFEAILHAVSRRKRVFDLGSDSPRQESLLFFKRKWGATQTRIPTYSHGPSAAPADSSDARYALARAVFRRLPLPLLEAAGRHLTPFLG
jgi:CelD/BcsL family acetyltransferase involved in cellulose biosynthesis